MSQTRSSSTASSGTRILSSEGPWMNYLKALGAKNFDEVENFLIDHSKYCENVSSSYTIDPALGDDTDHIPATIVDIDNDNTVRKWRTLSHRELYDPHMQAFAVDNFISGLHSSESNVHTRILLIHYKYHMKQYWAEGKDCPYAVEALLYGHIFGIELDLGLQGTKDILPPFMETFGNTPGDFCFRCAEDKKGRVIQCRRLGFRTVGSRQVDHVVIFLLENPDKEENVMFWKIAADKTQPSIPKPSEILKAGPKTRRPSPPECFLSILEAGEWKVCASVSRQSRSHWLDAIVRLMTYSVVDTLSNLGEMLQQEDGFSSSGDVAHGAGQLLYLSDLVLDQVGGFLKVDSDCTPGDCEVSLRSMRYTVQLVRSIMGRTRKLQDDRVASKQTEVAQMSIAETRSAIALTVLASVFVPISLATSIFGMNIQEINGSGHHIWTFVITAVVMLLSCGTAWLSWRAGTNINLIIMAASKRFSFWSDVSLPYKRRLMSEALLHFGDFRWYTRLGYWTGVRSLEKANARRGNHVV